MFWEARSAFAAPCYTSLVFRLALVFLSCLFCAPVAAEETVLVLPLSNAGKDKALDWVGESLSETLIEAFASAGVTVVAPDDRDRVLGELGVRRYAILTRASAMEIAVNLSATQVVFGEFEVTPAPAGSASKGTLRLACQILDVRRLRRVGDAGRTGSLEELSALQQALAYQVLRSAVPGFGVSEEAFRQSHPPVRLDAMESYVRGLLANSPDQKHKLLTTAVRLAPGFSQACFQLGRLNLFALRNNQAAAEWLQRVSPVDFHYREALFYLGLARFRTGEFRASAQALSKLSETVPLPEVLNNLGAALNRLNDAGAPDSFRKAIEADPADPDFHFNAGYALWRRGDFNAAAGFFRSCLQRNPDDEAATSMLGRCLKQQPYRAGDLRTEALERLKTEYNESAWLTLKAMLAPKP